MKKHIGGYKLNRDSSSRQPLLKTLVFALIDHEQVVTTKTKARASAPVFAKLLTRAKTDTLHNRRLVQAFVQDDSLVAKLFSDIAPRYKQVLGGYTQIIPVGNRRGDNASLVRLALTKRQTNQPSHRAKVEEATVVKKSAQVTTTAPVDVKATKSAPKQVKRTGKRGDK